MRCPNCQSTLRGKQYEGVSVESCGSCGGEWLDGQELGNVVRIRETRFSEPERRAIVESTTITGVSLPDVDRNLTCPKCGGSTDPTNYGGDTGIIIDRCTSCHGFWLDGQELEKIQMLVEGWDDQLPEDLREYGTKLRDVAVQVDKSDDASPSRVSFINSIINGILDIRA